MFHAGVHDRWQDTQTHAAYCRRRISSPKCSPKKEAPSDRVSFLTADSLWKTTAPTSRPEGGSVQLAVWLPGNTNCDELQCAGSQISAVMHSLLWRVLPTFWISKILGLSSCRQFSFFALNDFFFYQFLSTSVSYFFLITHKLYNAGCSANFTIFLPLALSPVLLKPFETMNQILEIFPPIQKCFNYMKILPSFAMFRASVYKLFYIQILHSQIATQPIVLTAFNKIRAQIIGFYVGCNCCVHRLDDRNVFGWIIRDSTFGRWSLK